MAKFYSYFLIFILVMTAFSFAATSERPMLARVDISDKSAIEILREGRFDIVNTSPGNYVEIVADDADFQKLQTAGLNPQIIHEDLVGFYQSRFPISATMGGFRTFSEAVAYMDSLHTQYPSITTAKVSIGTSWQGRSLWMMKISDNPGTDEPEPEVFVNGLIHAREPMGMEATLRFMKYLCENYGTDSLATYFVNNREFYFVPIINPDGYEHNRQTDPTGGGMWRKNMNSSGAVDLNRNWGYMWGYDDNGSSPYSGDETYRGTAAFSEPETQALRTFINSREFSVTMSFHTYGGYFLYPWGYSDIYTSDQSMFLAIGDSCVASSGYSRGTPWELLYNTNGDALDWQYGEQVEKPKILGFTMEMGDSWDGFWPDPSRIPTLWSHALPALIYLSKIAGNPYGMNPPIAPTMRPIGDVYTDPFTVRWQCIDTVNPAIAFELKEMSGLQRTTDNFDINSENWSLNGFTRMGTRPHSGGYSLFSGAQNGLNSSAQVVNQIQLAQHDTLKVWVWYDIELDWDYAYFQISTDGGNSFANLAGNITTNTSPHGQNQGNGITGTSTGWILGTFPLNSYSGQSAILGIRYITDVSVLGEGLYADDFYPVESFTAQNVLGSNITDTLFAISGRPEGTYYYQVRARDAEQQWSPFSNRQIAMVHPPVGPNCQYVPGDINGNGAANGLDVTYGVNYFKGGSEPPYSCECTTNNTWFVAADVNGSCAFNGLDITYLVQYYRGGPGLLYCADCPPSR